MSNYSYIKWFDEIGKDDIPVVGGKGANLGELISMGLPVPPGFCITASGYDKFIDYAELDEVVKFLMEPLDVDNVDALQEVGTAIQNKINQGEIYSELEDEIISAYREFSEKIGVKDPEVAVRSSATAEDLPDASFAGQQDTYLHIRGEEELIKHVRACWASLWTSRAIYYREKQNFDHFDVSLSVVIQKMVNSEKSGVMFTANPINNSKNEMMINASWGLGEAVVSGIVTPDEYIIDKNTKKVIEKNIATKNYMVVKKEDGVGTVQVNVKDVLGEEAVKGECLNDRELQTLIERGLKVEELYGSVQDTEWGFDKDTKEFYFLQSRPITTLEEDKKEVLKMLAKGLPASPGIGRGKVRRIKDITSSKRS